jgi:hypothetical protein
VETAPAVLRKRALAEAAGKPLGMQNIGGR